MNYGSCGPACHDSTTDTYALMQYTASCTFCRTGPPPFGGICTCSRSDWAILWTAGTCMWQHLPNWHSRLATSWSSSSPAKWHIPNDRFAEPVQLYRQGQAAEKLGGQAAEKLGDLHTQVQGLYPRERTGEIFFVSDTPSSRIPRGGSGLFGWIACPPWGGVGPLEACSAKPSETPQNQANSAPGRLSDPRGAKGGLVAAIAPRSVELIAEQNAVESQRPPCGPSSSWSS
jgi:hypothetical protein